MLGMAPGLSPMVKRLVIINAIVFFIGMIFQANLSYAFGLVPVRFWHGWIWQAFTYMFLHGGFGHIFFNMLVLWMFGTPLEYTWGSRKFLTFYLICGVGAGILNALVTPGSPIPVVGASGAIYGLLLAFGMLFPNQLIYIYFLFPIRAKFLVIIFGGIELFMAFSNPHSHVAHFAHLGGMLFGYLYLKKDLWLLRIKSRTRNVKDSHTRAKHLKVVFDREQEMDRLQQEIDDLLDKINRDGIESLSGEEIHRLKTASQKLKEWQQRM
ncbi:rhomboid family intramembrane serine protease [bacterium]|nr:rhomboid family intramembrane serine protease [bacterium]